MARASTPKPYRRNANSQRRGENPLTPRLRDVFGLRRPGDLLFSPLPALRRLHGTARALNFLSGTMLMPNIVENDSRRYSGWHPAN